MIISSLVPRKIVVLGGIVPLAINVHSAQHEQQQQQSQRNLRAPLAADLSPSSRKTTVCEDDTDWTYKQGQTIYTCSWVADNSGSRCSKTGQDGRLASDACFVTCGTCPAACVGPFTSTVTPTKSVYQEGEQIGLQWTYGAGEANVGDWISVYPSSFSGVGCDILTTSSTMWVYMLTKDQTYDDSQAPATTDSVVFDENPPDESGLQSWPLSVGSYRAFITRHVPGETAPYDTVAASSVFSVVEAPPPTDAPTPPPPAGQSVTDKLSYQSGEAIEIDWDYLNVTPMAYDFVAIYPSSYDGVGSDVLPLGSVMWVYAKTLDQSIIQTAAPSATGAVTFDGNAPDETGTQSWPLGPGTWRLFLAREGVAPYDTVAASQAFTVEGDTCPAAYSDFSTDTHLPPQDGLQVRRVAFSSCYRPGSQTSGGLWSHVRNFCGAKCVWNWLGDNMYQDTENMQNKRDAYNAARNNQYYRTLGPVANPKIPTTGTWDDHDFATNNQGKHYNCREQSQAEFAYHFNLDSTDPRHPDNPNKREGVYHSYMFEKDEGNPNGIHLINLDARYHRSPTYFQYGLCEGAASSMLGSDQWAWLDNELGRTSEVKIIGSGIQILPPTNQGGKLSMCAYDGAGGTFDSANIAVGEGPGFPSGTGFEQWGEMPEERTRLLHLVQESLAAGHAKKIIFMSGDQHWAEIMEKVIPARGTFPEATVWEVTASGIDQYWPFSVSNANRAYIRRADDQGNGVITGECLLPFSYSKKVKGQATTYSYDDCTTDSLPSGQAANGPWCLKSSSTSSWGYCEPANPKHVRETASKEDTCTSSALHVCSARANYGGIEVDWAQNSITMSIFTPLENEPLAGSITVRLDESIFV